MADTPRKDHWSALLETIGLSTATPQKPAEVTPVEPAPTPVAEAPAANAAPIAAAEPVAASPPAPIAEAPKPAPKKPAKTSGHWGKLAGMLGLSVAQPEPEPEPEPEPAPPPPAPVAPQAVIPAPRAPVSDDLPAELFAPPARSEVEPRPASPSRERDRGDRGERDRGGRGEQRRERGSERGSDRGPRSEGAPERSPRSERGPEREPRREDSERRPPRREGNSPRRGFGDGLVEDWQPESQPEPAAEVYEADDFIAPKAEAPAADERFGFDRPGDDSEGGGPRRRRRRRRGGRRPEEGGEGEQSELVPDRDTEPVSESFAAEPFADDVFADDEYPREVAAHDDEDNVPIDAPRHRRAPGAGEAGEAGEDRGPRRRRRRRRGGASREDSPRETRSPQPARSSERADIDADLDVDDDFDSAPPSPPPSSGRGRPHRDHRRPVSAEDDEVDEMLQAELDEDGGEGHAHKKIPTWQDTVGVLIDGNMSMRSERPETRGGHRGRRPPHRGR